MSPEEKERRRDLTEPFRQAYRDWLLDKEFEAKILRLARENAAVIGVDPSFLERTGCVSHFRMNPMGSPYGANRLPDWLRSIPVTLTPMTFKSEPKETTMPPILTAQEIADIIDRAGSTPVAANNLRQAIESKRSQGAVPPAVQWRDLNPGIHPTPESIRTVWEGFSREWHKGIPSSAAPRPAPASVSTVPAFQPPERPVDPPPAPEPAAVQMLRKLVGAREKDVLRRQAILLEREEHLEILRRRAEAVEGDIAYEKTVVAAAEAELADAKAALGKLGVDV